MSFCSRRQHMPAHLSFLEKNAARIKAAGPLRAASGESAGGLWVVEAESPDVVDALVKDAVSRFPTKLPHHHQKAAVSNGSATSPRRARGKRPLAASRLEQFSPSASLNVLPFVT
jgi:YCII-related domain